MSGEARCPACTEVCKSEARVGDLVVCGSCGFFLTCDKNENLVSLPSEEFASLRHEVKSRLWARHDSVRMSAYGKARGMNMRPIVKNGIGVISFRANPIVVKIFERAVSEGLDLQQLQDIRPQFAAHDWEEFLQLIGWPVSSYCAVDLVSTLGARQAHEEAHRIFPESI